MPTRPPSRKGCRSQSCRTNGVAPLAYFTHLYEHLPYATTVGQLEALLPWNVKALLKAITAAR